MIIGIGIDLVEIERIKKGSLENLVKRILSKNELNIYQTFLNTERKLQFLAGRFSAKEAYSKALGTGIGKVGFKDIEILNNNSGQPYINLNSQYKIHLSITHTANYASSFVIIES